MCAWEGPSPSKDRALASGASIAWVRVPAGPPTLVVLKVDDLRGALNALKAMVVRRIREFLGILSQL